MHPLYEGTNVPATYPLLHEYACTVLNPVHARDPLHESYPATRQRITTRLLRTHARTLSLHKIETCLPLLSLGTSLHTSGHRQRTFELGENFPFLHKETQFLKRRIQECYPAIARSPLISTWVMSLSHQEDELFDGRGRCRSFWMRSMKWVGITLTKLIP
jgi:hypothetical protein